MTNGVVTVSVRFLASGEIGGITLLSPLSKDLEKKALEAARKIKFLPAEIDGKPVDTSRKVEYTFSIY